MAARNAQVGARTPQQHIGMPGLAAAAGLCNGMSNIDQLMLSHALQQQRSGMQQQPAHPQYMGHQLGAYGEMMEPFAATKAILSVRGGAISPEVRGLAPTGACPPMMMGGAPPAGAVPGAYMQQAQAQAPTAPAAKAEKADGLLLLLACADDANGGLKSDARAAVDVA